MAIEFGNVVKVRTVNRRLQDERWSSIVIDFQQATFQQWARRGVVEPIGAAFDAHDLDTSEAQIAADLP